MAVAPGPTSRSLRPSPVGRTTAHATLDDLALNRRLLALRDDHPIEPWPGHRSHRSKFFEVLAALGKLTLPGQATEAILEAACELVAESLSVDAALVLEPTATPGRLAVRAGTGCLAAAVGEEAASGPGTQAGLALAQPGVATADARAASPADAFLARHRLATSLLVALPGPAGPLGLLGACEVERRAFEPDELAFLETAGAILAGALGRQQAWLERQRLEARLEAADRLISLGKLAGGVAHQLNNPLSYVTANLAFVAEEAGALAGRLEATGSIDAGLAASARQLVDAANDTRDGLETMRVLLRDLQTLSGGDGAALRPLDPTLALESSLNVAGSELRHRAGLERALTAALPPVLASEVRLGQLFLGLLVHVAEAIPDGHPEDHLVRITTGLVEGDRIAVEVVVTARVTGGVAVSGPTNGTGLAACRGAVEALGGELEVDDRAGRGITYRLLLPVAPVEGVEPRPSEPRAAVPAAGPAPVTGPTRGRILVVDDEPMVGTVLERSLGAEYEIVPVDSGRAALALLARGERFDLIFSDLLMPEMSGMDLSREVEAFSPELAARMVFLTGGAFTSATRDFLARPGVEFVEKPFDLATIRGAISRRLGRR
jgi:CheY-like chemotaxis protein/signal transduction histidine kinase